MPTGYRNINDYRSPNYGSSRIVKAIYGLILRDQPIREVTIVGMGVEYDVVRNAVHHLVAQSKVKRLRDERGFVALITTAEKPDLPFTGGLTFWDEVIDDADNTPEAIDALYDKVKSLEMEEGAPAADVAP